MNEVRNVLRMFPEPYRANISSRCNVGEEAVNQWEKRGVIPPKHHPELVSYAKECGLKKRVTFEFLSKFSRSTKAPP